MIAWQDYIKSNRGVRDPVDQGYRNVLADVLLWALMDYGKLYQAVAELRAAEANGGATDRQRRAVMQAVLNWLGHGVDYGNKRLFLYSNIVDDLGENVLAAATETLRSGWMRAQLVNLDINPEVADVLPEIVAGRGRLPRRCVRRSKV